VKQLILPHPEYIVDDKGKKKSVILSVKDYETLLREIRDLAELAERRDEPVKSHSDFVSELKADGYI
jgi:PHD/YefM family antitoxin component YafN of YafNO toxin-antitoxin module